MTQRRIRTRPIKGPVDSRGVSLKSGLPLSATTGIGRSHIAPSGWLQTDMRRTSQPQTRNRMTRRSPGALAGNFAITHSLRGHLLRNPNKPTKSAKPKPPTRLRTHLDATNRTLFFLSSPSDFLKSSNTPAEDHTGATRFAAHSIQASRTRPSIGLRMREEFGAFDGSHGPLFCACVYRLSVRALYLVSDGGPHHRSGRRTPAR